MLLYPRKNNTGIRKIQTEKPFLSFLRMRRAHTYWRIRLWNRRNFTVRRNRRKPFARKSSLPWHRNGIGVGRSAWPRERCKYYFISYQLMFTSLCARVYSRTVDVRIRITDPIEFRLNRTLNGRPRTVRRRREGPAAIHNQKTYRVATDGHLLRRSNVSWESKKVGESLAKVSGGSTVKLSKFDRWKYLN